jgi:hypothetical protein
MTIEAEDDFWDAAPAEPLYGVKNGRYIYPDPPGYQRRKGERGFMRMTNLAAAFSDQIRLQHWRERMILLGLREDEGLLFDELAAAPIEHMEPAAAKEWLEAHARRCADRAGAGVGARRGTARHVMVQTWLERDAIVGHRTMRLQLASLRDALAEHCLEPLPGWSERRVCNPALRAMGTLDMGVRCTRTGQIGVLDLKTQRGFWSYLEIAGQQYGYTSAPWAWDGPPDDGGRWVPAPEWNLTGHPDGDWPGRPVALLAHMPQEPGPGQLPVEIHEVSLEDGQAVMLQALGNVELRSRGASVAPGRRIGCKRPTYTT